MRLRFKKNAHTILENSTWLLKEGNQFKNVKAKLEVEIGMGKGDFLIAKALDNSNTNYLGIEMYESVLMIANNKLEALETKPCNIKLLSIDARKTLDVLKARSVSAIYLNFSDPWPKFKHAKRRLTHVGFLELYYKLLKKGGLIEIKTDQAPLYEFSLEQIAEFKKFVLIRTSTNLHSQEIVKYQTEYEKKFVAMGHPIYHIVLKKP